MSSRFAVEIAIGLSLGVIGAYLLAGGGSYEPLEAADPCEQRPAEITADRGVFEGIVLSALDGAACELGVSREELTLALGDETSLAAFEEANGFSDDEVTEAVRAGLLRAIDDAETQGRLPSFGATAARFIVNNAPVATALDAFRALPGDPSVPDILQQLQRLNLGFDEFLGSLDDLSGDLLEQLGDALGGAGSALPEDIPSLPSLEGLPGFDELSDELQKQLDALGEGSP